MTENRKGTLWLTHTHMLTVMFHIYICRHDKHICNVYGTRIQKRVRMYYYKYTVLQLSSSSDSVNLIQYTPMTYTGSDYSLVNNV